jgi:ABC-type multidrug transport system fused ATPase/permease subunit
MIKEIRTKIESQADDLKTLYSAIAIETKSLLLVTALVMVFAAILEAITIIAFIPFLTSLVEPEKLLSDGRLIFLIRHFEIEGARDLLIATSTSFGVIVFVSTIFKALQLWLTTKTSFIIGSAVSQKILENSLYGSYLSHLSRNTADVIAAITTKTSTVIYQVIIPTLTLFGAITMLLFIGGAIVVITPSATLFGIVFLFIIYLIIISISKKKLRDYGELHSKNATECVKIAHESLGGIRDVIIGGTQQYFLKAFANADLHSRKSLGQSQFISLSPKIFIEGIALIFIAIAAAYASSIHSQVATSLPIVGALVLSVQKILPLMQQVFWCWSTYESGRKSLQDVSVLIKDEANNAEFSQINNINTDVLCKSIHLDRIYFRYPNASLDAISGLTIKICKGDRIGVVGHSGSGKSTLIDLICMLFPPTSGCIYFDDQPASAYTRNLWLRKLAIVPQQIYLSDASLLENIAFGELPDQINYAKAVAAANNAQLESVIESLPDGYHTRIGERGCFLSEGQRQRIGIARALYKDASVIIFDEATSALDNETENAIISCIEKLSKDITVIMIAHRISTLKSCDRILELSDGFLVRECKFNEIQ